MMEISKADWKLFRSRIADWQEAYMERLIKEYVTLLNGEGAASDKFWELDERIKKDKRNPGVLIELHKQDVPYDLVRLINLGVKGVLSRGHPFLLEIGIRSRLIMPVCMHLLTGMMGWCIRRYPGIIVGGIVPPGRRNPVIIPISV